MLAEFNGRVRSREVRVVGRGDEDAVDLLGHFVEEFAPVVELLGVGVFGAHLLDRVAVGVAEGGDLLAAGRAEMRPAAPAHADVGEPDLGILRVRARRPRIGQHDGGRAGRPLQKPAT